ncbi:MAG TPA: proofreading thioesterase EntH [Buttiauxella sp.]|jgi:uncharacterized protein (TIGR00369 family)
MIWKRQVSLDELNRMGENSMVALLGITFTKMDDDSLEAEMPVDARTHQPFGLLHGGASAALAETLGSMAGFLTTEEGQCVVGTEISASHHRAVSSGSVRGVCKPLHLGRTSQVWEIAIYDRRGNRCCTSRLTTATLG